MTLKKAAILLISGIMSVTFSDPAGAECITEAQKLFSQEDYRGVILVLDRCKEEQEAWRMLGEAYHHLYEMEEARYYLEKHLEISPDDLDADILHASALAYTKDFRNALRKYRSLQKNHPDNTDIQKGLARTLGWNREYEAGLSIYRSILQKDPHDVEASLGIALLLSWQKKFRQAVTELDKIIASEPETEYLLRAMLQKAEVLSWQKKFDQSIAQYRAVIELEPETIEAYLGIGTVLEWQGKYKEAKANYEEAIIVDPQSSAVRNRLDQLMWVK